MLFTTIGAVTNVSPEIVLVHVVFPVDELNAVTIPLLRINPEPFENAGAVGFPEWVK